MTSDVIKNIIADIIGTYNYTGSGFGNIDFEYLAAAATFLICLWFTFSFIRTFLCGVMNRRW